MSGYSFDIDPIYDGGGYLVRQWQRRPRAVEPDRARRRAATSPACTASLDRAPHRRRRPPRRRGERRVEVLTVDSLQAGVDRPRPRRRRPATASASRPGRRPTSSSTTCASPPTDPPSRRRSRAVPSPAWRSRSTRASPRSRTTTGGTATPARSSPTCSHPGCTARDRDPRRRLRAGRQRRVARRARRRSSASTCRPTRSRSCSARRPETTPGAGEHSRRCRSPTRASTSVVGITVLYTVARRSPRAARARARARTGRRAPAGRARLRIARGGRTTPPCTAGAATAAPSSPQLAHGQPASRCERATYAYSFLAPPAAALGAVDRLRRPATTATDTATRRPTSSGAPSTASFAPLARAERRWLAHHDVPVRHVGHRAGVGYPLTAERRSRPRRSTTSPTHSPARSHSVRAIAASRKNSDLPYTRR